MLVFTFSLKPITVTILSIPYFSITKKVGAELFVKEVSGILKKPLSRFYLFVLSCVNFSYKYEIMYFLWKSCEGRGRGYIVS